MGTGTTVFSIRLDEKTRALLLRLAEHEERSRGDVLKRLIRREARRLLPQPAAQPSPTGGKAA